MLQEDGKKIFNTDGKNLVSHNSDDRYRTLFERVNAAAFLTSLDGKILEANMKSAELLDYTWDEILKLYLQDILPQPVEWSQLIEEISSRGGITFETENIKKNGEIVPVEINASLFQMEGKPVMLSLIQDITERKKAEMKLKESEQKYRGLFESTTDGIILLDARGEILDVNTKTSELLGLSRQDLLGSNFLNLGVLTQRSLSILVEQFEQLLSDKISRSHETEIKDKNGKILNIELTSFFMLQKDNEVDNFVLTIRDISERKQAEIKLAREHELLQTLMDNIPDSIYFKDEQNKFVLVNKAKAMHSNVNPGDMIGKTDFDFLPKDIAMKAFEDDEDIMRTGKFIINKIEKISGKDGYERWVSVTKVPRFDEEGNIIGTMGISRDITEWKRLEESYNKTA